MRVRAELRAVAGTDVVLDVEGQTFVVTDPKQVLRQHDHLTLELTPTRPTSAGIFQARYRVRPTSDRALIVLSDEARVTTNVLRTDGERLPAVVHLTLYPASEAGAGDGLQPLECAPCLPNCDVQHLLLTFLQGCPPKDARP